MFYVIASFFIKAWSQKMSVVKKEKFSFDPLKDRLKNFSYTIDGTVTESCCPITQWLNFSSTFMATMNFLLGFIMP